MTAQQILLIKKSWRVLRMIDPALLGGVFYDKLFSINPGLKKYFSNSQEMQAKKIISMLDTVILHLENFEHVQADIHKLGERHTSYGTRQEHYELVGKALLWTLGQALGAEWTRELEAAWHCCYKEISDQMLKCHQSLKVKKNGVG